MNHAIEALLIGTSFYKALPADYKDRVQSSLLVQPLEVGEAICRRGSIADRWFGVAEGTIKIENTGLDGRPTTLTNFSAGCWFGEGTLLKHEVWPYSAIATTTSTVASIPAATFHWLLNNSLPFSHFLIGQLNARLAQFVQRCEHARLHQPQQHVAHCLAELVDRRIHPRSVEHLQISQEDLARLAGVSRSLVSRVLQELELEGLVRNDYRSITVSDPEGLRAYSDA